ncbi:MAG TPA: serine protease [Caulobacteraceae bacterium]|jgi:S1-C subfamily serine protease|nr:serine protease [Caulobacteraceae bacterium]
MAPAVTVDLIAATVELEQPLGGGMRTVGTGFLVSDPTTDGRPRVVLVTADHVFERMKDDQATIGFRTQQADGEWSFTPGKIQIRAAGKPLWRKHPTRDVAAISISAPPAFARAAIPLTWLAGDDTLSRAQLSPGDEMLTLGYPEGLSSNAAGFPILRSGRVASYPLGTSKAYPTFLLDFHVFPGNSGGPVYLEKPAPAGAQAGLGGPVVAGMLTQQVEVDKENLGIGIVTQAEFIRETVALVDLSGASAPAGPAMISVAQGERPAGTVGARAVSAASVARDP